MDNRNTRMLLTVREILLERLKTYAAEVESGRHVPPPPRNAALQQTPSAAGGLTAR